MQEKWNYYGQYGTDARQETLKIIVLCYHEIHDHEFSGLNHVHPTKCNIDVVRSQAGVCGAHVFAYAHVAECACIREIKAMQKNG